jgi:beta-glucanase (GH16 family)
MIATSSRKPPVTRLHFSLMLLLATSLATPSLATYSLVWSDEFEGASLDLSNWSYDVGNGCPDLCGWGNAELEYYRTQNVAVADGNLVITAKAENYAGYQFTSGKIHTRGKQSFLYGRIEMRAKLPTGGGMWPAFWMMPQDDVYGGWAASGEIDIMESANATTSVGGALHYGGEYPANTSTSSSYSLGGANFADDFHVYAVEWEPDVIRWYVDDVNFATRYSSQWYSTNAPDNPRAPFDQEFYIILNAAVGGYYTGCTDPGCITADFPQEYIIDYVRVYEDIVNEAPTVTITSPTEADNPPAGNITVTATATDADGSVTVVEFYDGGSLLGQDTTAPYSFTWNGVADGCYQLTARAVDDLGGVGTDLVDLTVGAGCGQEPYLGSPFVLPVRIEAEDYDLGGEGVAYHDLDPANSGTQYRPDEGVDIQACLDTGGGFNVGWISPGEWIEYTVEVPVAGRYTLDTRVSSVFGGGVFHVEFDGTDRTGDIQVESTTGWQTWDTVSSTVTLPAGLQVMRFVATAEGFNVNHFELALDSVTPVPEAKGPVATLLPSYPNPFNPATTLSFELRDPATVNLTVFDVAGKVVRVLVANDRLAAGRHERLWDGRDQAGRLAPAGVYFYRLTAGDFTDTGRMALVK